MRRLATTLLLGALLAGWGLVVAAPAAACSCAVPPDDTADYFEAADIVFTGRLVSRTVEHPGGEISSSLDPALHVFAVDGVFKGAVGERQDVVSADFGASCGLELAGEGPFVVYATEADGGYTAGLCGGTTLATPNLEAQLTALADPGTSSGAGPTRLPGADGTDATGTDAYGPPTAVLAAGALVLLVGGALLLRRRRTVH